MSWKLISLSQWRNTRLRLFTFLKVSSLYMDPSIGNYIKVVVVKIILVEGMQANHDLKVSSNADETLTSFCRWQQEMNPDNDENPHHHDVAILVTRQDICSQHDTPCRYEQPFLYYTKSWSWAKIRTSKILIARLIVEVFYSWGSSPLGTRRS